MSYMEKIDSQLIPMLRLSKQWGPPPVMPPEGYARWSLRLLAEKVVELDYIDSISHEAIRRVLKKTESSLGSEKVG